MSLNWGWVLIRLAIFILVLTLLFLSQRFWYRLAWRLTARIKRQFLRGLLRGAWVAALIAVVLAVADTLRLSPGRIIPRGSMIAALAGLWLASALFAYLSVKTVAAIEWLWRLRRPSPAQAPPPSPEPSVSALITKPASEDVLPNPSRRYFFQTATALAGAMPFVGALYGFAAERLHYVIHNIDLPIANLPPALEGLRIVQLSDIHMSGYMTRHQVRRAIDMARELRPDLAVVTGDFITSAGDPLADCIAEIARLHPSLGVWGCNGNHEVYAGVEDDAQELFDRAGMRLLRQQNAQLTWRGAPFNLIGVDYQRQRTRKGHPAPMLESVPSLIRRDMPNFLLSHNPNAFPRAAALGIELTLSGHTHGGQVQVEILDHRFSPARFITDFTAGPYSRPLARATQHPHPLGTPAARHSESVAAALYVNRGLGTVGAPIRIGVPPEITLLILKRA